MKRDSRRYFDVNHTLGRDIRTKRRTCLRYVTYIRNEQSSSQTDMTDVIAGKTARILQNFMVRISLRSKEQY